MLSPGASPAQEQKCSAVGNFLTSEPISPIIAVADVKPIPGMVVKRSMSSFHLTDNSSMDASIDSRCESDLQLQEMTLFLCKCPGYGAFDFGFLFL